MSCCLWYHAALLSWRLTVIKKPQSSCGGSHCFALSGGSRGEDKEQAAEAGQAHVTGKTPRISFSRLEKIFSLHCLTFPTYKTDNSVNFPPNYSTLLLTSHILLQLMNNAYESPPCGKGRYFVPFKSAWSLRKITWMEIAWWQLVVLLFVNTWVPAFRCVPYKRVTAGAEVLGKPLVVATSLLPLFWAISKALY